jgi:prevent-host-death family protein
MKIVPLNEVKNRFSTYLELSKQEDIVVTKNGRPAAILHAVTDEDLEDYLFESDPRFIARIEALRREFQRDGGTPLANVRKELGLPASRRRGTPPRRRRPSSDETTLR